MSSASNKLDNFLEKIFEDEGAQGVVECLGFLLGAFVITEQGVVVGASQDFIDMIEYSRQELYGMSVMELIAEDEREEMAGIFTNNDTQRYELKLEPKSKIIKNVLVAPRIFKASDGKYRLAEFIDISMSKQKEEALFESEKKFQSVFERAAVGMARVSPQGLFVEVNQKLCDMLGYSKEILMKKTFQELTHPDDLKKDLEFVNKLLRDELTTYSMEKRYFHENGTIIWINSTVSLVSSATGEPKYFIAVIEDIGKRKEIERRLEIQATHDPLTGLCNRQLLDIEMGKELARAVRYDRPLSVLMIDIDHFKVVNDTYGHQAGDQVLEELAKIMELSSRDTDIVGRYGGEEFLLVLPELDNKQALIFAERIRKMAKSLNVIFNAQNIHISVSVGVATYPEHGAEVEKLITASDNAMYKAKANGRDQVVCAG